MASVPKLRGRENYSEWVFAAENFLVLEGMSNCIKAEDSTVSKEDDAKTKAKLIMTIDSALYIHIKQVKTTRELWLKLKNLFDDSGFSRRISLLRSLISIRLENSASMTSYVTQIIETSQKLIGTGFNINEEWIGSLLLAGLPEKYFPMIMAIEHSGISITADAIKTKLLDMEESGSGDTNRNSAFSSFHKKKTGNTYGNKQTPKTKVIHCYKCKQTGHYRNQCPNNDKKSAEKTLEYKRTNAFSAVFLNGNFSKHDFYVDSGASAHLIANEDWLRNVSHGQAIKEIVVANKQTIPVKCSGEVQILTSVNNSVYEIVVKDVLCVPSLTTNLLSVSQLIAKGNSVKFTDNGCEIYNTARDLVATACLVNGVYKLNMPDCLSAAMVVTNEIWHRRLGHVNSLYLNKMTDAVEGLTLDRKTDITKSSCVVCCEGKQSRLPFPQKGTRSQELLQLVHTDLCGPMEKLSIGGSKYFMLLIDDYSQMTHIYFLKSKSEALHYFQQYKAEVENQLNHKVKSLRSDNGTEFCNKLFQEYLQQEGIIHQKSNPYTPEQNGSAERKNRTVIEKSRCLLFDAGLDKQFWAEAANTAVYLQNRTIAASLNGKTPFEIWTGSKPDVSHLRIFGSTVMVHVPKEKRLKWDKKSEKCILVGYPDNVKGYRVYNPRTKTVSTSRDVIIVENTLETESKIVITEKSSEKLDKTQDASDVKKEDGRELSSADSVGDPESLEVSHVSDSTMKATNSTVISSQLSDDDDDTFLPCEVTNSSDSSLEQNDTVEWRRQPVRNRKKPDRYGFSHACGIIQDEDISGELVLREALNGPEREQWLAAIGDELQCFEDNGAWELVDPPKNGTIVQCKWVLRKKHDSDNNVSYRARLVAKGFSQKYGIDYVETFSPVVRHSTLRLLFALSVQLELDVTHLDVKTAFLNGELEEIIYMEKPECLDSQWNKVLKLKKAIYGLKQASRAWNKKVDSCLLSNGYTQSKLEHCMYIKNENQSKTIVTVYVDDFFIFSNNVVEVNRLKIALNKQFKIKDLGQVKHCLGMNINFNKTEGSVTLSQESYIDKLLNKFHMSECKPVDTPIEYKLNVGICENQNKNVNKHIPYQQLIGSLMFLSVLTRPDISYSVGYLSQFNNCHTEEHWSYAKRILKYLKKTKSFGIKYFKSGNSQIIGFVDADWASNIIDRRSYTGFCFLLCNGVISWECKKQKTVALSSTEAEYMGLSEACKEAVYLRSLQYEIANNMYTFKLFNDNQSAQKLTENPIFHKRSKHIDIRYHFCRECVSNKVVTVHYMPTTEMPADILTKGLCSNRHYNFMNKLGIVPV